MSAARRLPCGLLRSFGLIELSPQLVHLFLQRLVFLCQRRPLLLQVLVGLLRNLRTAPLV
jgi:hypothetical protein